MGAMPSVKSPDSRVSVDHAAPVTPASGEPRSGRPFWREPLAPYATARLGRAMLELATAVVPYVALSVLMYLALSVSYLLVLAIAVPAAGFLLRTYMVFHDCAHGSFLPSRRANVWLGTALGLVVFSPFQSWRHNHAVHHATAGDLERRGVGDVFTLTVTEYHARRWPRRLAYRLFRNPLVMFGLGPMWAMFIQPRLVSRSMRPRIRRGISRRALRFGPELPSPPRRASVTWMSRRAPQATPAWVRPPRSTHGRRRPRGGGRWSRDSPRAFAIGSASRGEVDLRNQVRVHHEAVCGLADSLQVNSHGTRPTIAKTGNGNPSDGTCTA